MLLISHPGCSSHFLLPEDFLGKEITCPYDGCRIRVTQGVTFSEKHWLTMTNLHVLRQYMQGQISKRKERLFAVACCRQIWHLMTDERSRDAVRAVERIADGLISLDEFFGIHRAAEEAVPHFPPDERPSSAEQAQYYAACAARQVTHVRSRFSGSAIEQQADLVAHYTASALAYSQDQSHDHTTGEQAGQPVLYREIVGNPFRWVTVDPAWRTWGDGIVPRLAKAIYVERAFDRLPILADALEDAGCDDADILAHCRSGGEHVRGCWVVDLLPGKQ
jgi:hypothetical protein